MTEKTSVDLVCQGRAYRDGKWLPWHTISATVYQNRLRWPRDGYQVRIVIVRAAAALGEQHDPAE